MPSVPTPVTKPKSDNLAEPGGGLVRNHRGSCEAQTGLVHRCRPEDLRIAQNCLLRARRRHRWKSRHARTGQRIRHRRVVEHVVHEPVSRSAG